MEIYIVWSKASYYAYEIKYMTFDKRKAKELVKNNEKNIKYWIETKNIEEIYPDAEE